ncbi:lipase, partial [[Eubacterium] siraeum]|nr:lipase [[Eubacterium] siraeum]
QENNLARPSIAAWNIHHFLITSGNLSTDVLVHLYNKQPKYVLFSMGLKDVNLTTKEQFVENYMQLLYQCKQASPNSEFIFMAVTPVRSKFCKNEKIDVYYS